MTLSFDRDFEPARGRAVEVAPGVRRLTANNASAYTFAGTNTYLVGAASLAVIDPGPDGDEAHYEALLEAIGGRAVSHILVSHTHRDHSPLARRLARETGATVLAEGPHRPARPLAPGETNPFEASADAEFAPDIALRDGDVVAGEGWRIAAVLTPGHTANHACFALEGTGVLFSADHVMAWASTIIAPPDGAMGDYMRSLDKLIARDDQLLLPGHGGPIGNPRPFLRALKAHRRMRERAILQRVREGDRSIAAIVAATYRDIDPRLHGGAALSVLAHLEELVGRGLVRATEGPPGLGSEFEPG